MTAASSPTVVRLSVTGMHCASCVALVEETVRELPGVTEVAVSLEEGEATVSYDPGVVDLTALCAAVAEAGYAASPSADEGGAPRP